MPAPRRTDDAAGTGGFKSAGHHRVLHAPLIASDAVQVIGSVAKHRAGQDGLVILEIDAAALGDMLRWEPSRGGALFPHIHGALPVAAVLRNAELPLGADGRHVFPWGLGAP